MAELIIKDALGAAKAFDTLQTGDGLVAKSHLVDAAGVAAMGEVATSPAANSVLGRLKTIATNLGAVVLAAGTAVIGKVGLQVADADVSATNPIPVVSAGRTVVAGGSFSRPANTTAYASADLVANSTTAGSVAAVQVTAARVNAGTGRITRAKLKKSGTTTTNASFRVHLYRDDPAAASGITNGDNGAFLTKEANYLGAFDITVDRAFSDAAIGVGAPVLGPFISFAAAAGSQILYALIEARAAYTPASGETFTLALDIDQD